MRSEGSPGARGLVSALVLAIVGLAIAWICVRTTVVGLMPSNAPAVMKLAPGSASAALGRATTALGRNQGLLGGPRRKLDAATLDTVRQAAAAAPLDARSFLILGYQQLAEGKPARALRSLEAGQRLAPRNRLIHLLLLERYLLTSRFADAATQFSVLARLVGAAQPAIAAVMAQMIVRPEMRDAARQTLRNDPELERAVLATLARSNTEPAVIFALASPAALADAGGGKSWGPVLISRLVEAGRFRTAREVWRRIYRLPDGAVAAPIFNPSFRPTPASPPFDWTLVAGSLGAADPQGDALSIDYYGRDSGDLASQLLVLAPGRYQLVFSAEGGKPNAAARLFWTVACAGGGKTVLTNVAVPTAPGAHRAAGTFTVPDRCVAQTLALRGEAGEFPSPISLTIGDLAIRALTETAP